MMRDFPLRYHSYSGIFRGTMIRGRLLTITSFALLLFGSVPVMAQWKEVKYRNRDYVTLRSFCEFYGFRYEPLNEKRTTILLGQRGQVKLTLQSRDVEINGVKYNLSFPIASDGRDFIISKTDIISLFEPVLRPYRVKKKDRATTIIIDAGHGGSDSGAGGRSGIEKQFTLDTAFRLKRHLERLGYRTIMTRTNDTFIPLDRRAQTGGGRSNTIFISIHFNKGQSRAGGIETFALAPRGGPSTGVDVVRVADFQAQSGNRTDEQNILLATAVHRAAIRNTNAVDRGVKRARFWVLRYNDVPAILFEGGFLSNPTEARLIARESYRETLARSIAEGVVAYNRLMEGGSDTGRAADREIRPAMTKRSDDDEEMSPRQTSQSTPVIETTSTAAQQEAAEKPRQVAQTPAQSTPRSIGRGLVSRQPAPAPAIAEPVEAPAAEPAPETPAKPEPAPAPRPAPKAPAPAPPPATTPKSQPEKPKAAAPTTPAPAPPKPPAKPAAPAPAPTPAPEKPAPTVETVVIEQQNVMVVSQPDESSSRHLRDVPTEISVSKLLELATNAPPEKVEEKPSEK